MQQASDDICLLAFRHNYKRPSTKHETNRSTPKKPTHHSPVQPEIFCQSKGCLLFTSPSRAEIDGTVVSLHIWCHSRLTPTQFPALNHILNSVSDFWDPVESPVETVDERPLPLRLRLKRKSPIHQKCVFARCGSRPGWPEISSLALCTRIILCTSGQLG